MCWGGVVAVGVGQSSHPELLDLHQPQPYFGPVPHHCGVTNPGDNITYVEIFTYVVLLFILDSLTESVQSWSIQNNCVSAVCATAPPPILSTFFFRSTTFEDASKMPFGTQNSRCCLPSPNNATPNTWTP